MKLGIFGTYLSRAGAIHLQYARHGLGQGLRQIVLREPAALEDLPAIELEFPFRNLGKEVKQGDIFAPIGEIIAQELKGFEVYADLLQYFPSHGLLRRFLFPGRAAGERPRSFAIGVPDEKYLALIPDQARRGSPGRPENETIKTDGRSCQIECDAYQVAFHSVGAEGFEPPASSV